MRKRCISNLVVTVLTVSLLSGVPAMTTSAQTVGKTICVVKEVQLKKTEKKATKAEKKVEKKAVKAA